MQFYLLTDCVFCAGLFDVAKERARLGKQREKLAKDLAAVAARVSDQAFLAKAPPHVVAEARALSAGQQEGQVL